MGTSLSGLTPQTTFDGLLKVGDNDPLTADLKAISTGDGTDTILSLSNSALQIGGTFNVDGGIATFKGVGSSYLTSSFIIKNSADAEIFRVRDDGQIYATYISAQSVNASSYALYGADYAPNIRVNIKGSGATSATTSLLVQNSAGANLLQANDDGVVLIGPENTYKNHLLELKGNGSNAELLLRLQSSFNGAGGYTGVAFTNSTNGSGISSSIRAYRESDHYALALNFGSNAGTDVLRAKNTGEVGIGETSPTARLHVKGSGNTNLTTSLLVQNSDGADMMVLDDSKEVSFKGRAGFYNGVFIVESNHTKTQGSAMIGAYATPSAQLQVKGSGATSATTALLVQNSAGTELFKVQDNGKVTLGGLGFEGGIISGNAYFSQIVYGPNYYRKADGSTAIGSGTAADTGVRLQVKGSGNTATTTALLVQNSDAENIMAITDDGYLTYRTPQRELLTLGNGSVLKYGTNSSFSALYNRASIYDGTNTTQFENGNVGIGNGTTTPTARLQVKGQGATGATTSLLVQNSAGTDLLRVNDDGNFYGQSLNVAGVLKMNSGQTIRFSGSEAMRGNISTGTLDLGEHSNFTNTRVYSQLSVIGTGNDATTTALLVQNSDGLDMVKVTDDSKLNLNFAGQTNNPMTLRGSGSQSHFIDGGNDLTLGYSFVKVSNSTHFAYGASNKAVGVGTSSIASSTKMHIKGGGATSATTALLVENSAGTEAFKVLDNGEVIVPTTSTFKVSSFSVQLGRIYPTTQDGDLGWNASTSYHFRNIYSKGVTHITDNTTSSTTLDASAKLQVDSTTQGFLPPRMTTTQRDAISTPAAGLMIYNTDTNTAECWNTSAWMPMF